MSGFRGEIFKGGSLSLSQRGLGFVSGSGVFTLALIVLACVALVLPSVNGKSIHVGYTVDVVVSEGGLCRVSVKTYLYNATGVESIYVPARASVLSFRVNGVRYPFRVECVENGTLISFKTPGTAWTLIELEYETSDYHGFVSGLDVFAYGFVPDEDVYNFTLTLRLPPGYGVRGVVMPRPDSVYSDGVRTVSYTHLTLPTTERV